MGFGVRGGDKKVIHIDNKPSFSHHIAEQVIHEVFECYRGIAKAKEHDSWFRESFVCDKGCLPLVTIFDTNIVVPPMNIKFCEVMGIFQLIDEIRDKREGVYIACGTFIKISVVLAGVEFPILFLDKEEG